MCFTPEINVEQSLFGYGEKYEKAREEARGGRPIDKRRLDSSSPVERNTISMPPKYWNMIPEGANRSQWIRGAIMSSATPPFTRTNYNRQTFQNGAQSIVTDPSLSPSQMASCLTSFVEFLVSSGPI